MKRNVFVNMLDNMYNFGNEVNTIKNSNSNERTEIMYTRLQNEKKMMSMKRENEKLRLEIKEEKTKVAELLLNFMAFVAAVISCCTSVLGITNVTGFSDFFQSPNKILVGGAMFFFEICVFVISFYMDFFERKYYKIFMLMRSIQLFIISVSIISNYVFWTLIKDPKVNYEYFYCAALAIMPDLIIICFSITSHSLKYKVESERPDELSTSGILGMIRIVLFGRIIIALKRRVEAIRSEYDTHFASEKKKDSLEQIPDNKNTLTIENKQELKGMSYLENRKEPKAMPYLENRQESKGTPYLENKQTKNTGSYLESKNKVNGNPFMERKEESLDKSYSELKEEIIALKEKNASEKKTMDVSAMEIRPMEKQQKVLSNIVEFHEKEKKIDKVYNQVAEFIDRLQKDEIVTRSKFEDAGIVLSQSKWNDLRNILKAEGKVYITGTRTKKA